MMSVSKLINYRPTRYLHLARCRIKTFRPISLAKKELIDDPGGFKAKLENVYGRNNYILPKEIRSIMLRRTGSLYDVELDMNDATGWFVRIVCCSCSCTSSFSDEKLVRICASLNKWGCADAVRDALENMNGPTSVDITIDLGMGRRWLAEFE